MSTGTKQGFPAVGNKVVFYFIKLIGIQQAIGIIASLPEIYLHAGRILNIEMFALERTHNNFLSIGNCEFVNNTNIIRHPFRIHASFFLLPDEPSINIIGIEGFSVFKLNGNHDLFIGHLAGRAVGNVAIHAGNFLSVIQHVFR